MLGMSSSRGLRTIVLGMVCLATASAWSQGRARVAILDFENKAHVSRDVASALVDMTTETLVNANKFTIIERSQLEKVANEQALGASGSVDASSAARIGAILGADYLLLGIVTEASASTSQTRVGDVRTAKTIVTLSLDVRFVDADTSAVKFADTYTRRVESVQVGSTSSHFDVHRGDSGKLARQTVRDLSRNVLSSIYPPQVMKFDAASSEVTINYGDVMFSPGERWTILRRGEELIDPATGEVLDFEEEEVGVLTVSSVGDKVTRGSVDGVAAVGDLCRLRASAPAAPARDREKVDPF